MCSVAALCDSGHGGDMAGGAELSAATGNGVSGREKTRREGEGIDAEAHSGSNGGVGELRKRLERAGQRGRSPAADGEDEDDGVASGVPRACGSSWSSVESGRSLWAWRKGEGVALGTVAANGGGGRSRVSSGKSRGGGGGPGRERGGREGVRGTRGWLQKRRKQEEAWRARRCRGVPPLPTGRGRR